MQVSYDASGLVAMGQPTYTPMYLWLYKQDSANNYRLLRADQPAPDGMESSQAKALQNALAKTREELKALKEAQAAAAPEAPEA